jgi:hypothetical protein
MNTIYHYYIALFKRAVKYLPLLIYLPTGIALHCTALHAAIMPCVNKIIQCFWLIVLISIGQ